MSVRGIQSSTSPIQQYKRQEKPVQPQVPERKELPAAPQTQPTDLASGGVLTAPEKEFFEGLFPGAKTDIRSHNMYHKDGSTSSKPIGTVVDRKG